MLNKFWGWCWNSATIVVARVGMAVSGGLLAVSQLAEVLDMPEVKQQLAAFLSPRMVGIIGVASFIIVQFARKRSLNKS
jgi:hypothetical protein